MNGKVGQREWLALLEKIAAEERLVQAVFSAPRRKDGTIARKATVRPVTLKGGLRYQFERLADNKAFHENVNADELAAKLANEMTSYKQALIQTTEADIQALANKKGELTLIARAKTSDQEGTASKAVPQTHNRDKRYVLPEGEPVLFLVALGVMTPEGKVVKAKYDKFRQINRFLEMVADAAPELPRGKPLHIVDFGCGKSYLTFALYHYLAVKMKLPVRIFGLDLKKDVIEACSKLASELGWEELTFAVGDISDFKGQASIDMVVTLHACDTATDAALLKAIGWGASVILSVPCCQHELFRQISQPVLQPLLKHGILKERFAALATDAIRANLLELAGYRTQMLEFIDLEHTPKNLLIRAVKSRGSSPASIENLRAEYERFRDFLSVSPFMEREN
ncbi:class I SAM-dependent methyltransferase [Cohnella cellulosilytica]|uniref:Class I SAM-dependent methyltransferase n=1 Tax=Cohnella cellulosilytica TaxID=986710 RepID=A0ABW2F7W8_9BACL